MAGNAVPSPSRVRVRMYQVGFGDCFLLTFEYAVPLHDGRDQRNILVDLGSTRKPPSGTDTADVARLIAQHCAGNLDVLVVSHRHKDHLSGFGTKESKAIIDGLAPKLTVRPWTEDPTAAADAREGNPVGDESRAFVRGLREGQTFAETLARSLGSAQGRGLRADLKSLALDEVSNADAVAQLDQWASTGAASYVCFGSPTRIEEFVPGIRVRALGPPTLEQHPGIARQRVDDPDEFWMLYRRLLDEMPLAPVFADGVRAEEGQATSGGALGPERWLIERLSGQQLASYLRIVRILDDVLNNSSIILVIDAGTQRLLLPGDAQIENWEYALRLAPEAPEARQLLSEVDLYKVGHHGSRNATPRSLFKLWTDGGAVDRPMTAMMSTLSGVHGDTEATHVPRATLVGALRERMALHSTEELSEDEEFVEMQASTTSSDPFKRT